MYIFPKLCGVTLTCRQYCPVYIACYLLGHGSNTWLSYWKTPTSLRVVRSGEKNRFKFQKNS